MGYVWIRIIYIYHMLGLTTTNQQLGSQCHQRWIWPTIGNSTLILGQPKGQQKVSIMGEFFSWSTVPHMLDLRNSGNQRKGKYNDYTIFFVCFQRYHAKKNTTVDHDYVLRSNLQFLLTNKDGKVPPTFVSKIGIWWMTLSEKHTIFAGLRILEILEKMEVIANIKSDKHVISATTHICLFFLMFWANAG